MSLHDEVMAALPEGAELVGNNQFELNGIKYELQITGEIGVTPSPARQTIIDAITNLFRPHNTPEALEALKEEIDIMSVVIITDLFEKFDITPRPEEESDDSGTARGESSQQVVGHAGGDSVHGTGGDSDSAAHG